MATEAHTSERAPASVIEQRMKNAAKLAAVVGIPLGIFNVWLGATGAALGALLGFTGPVRNNI